MCSDSDALIKSYVPSSLQSDDLVDSTTNLKVPAVSEYDWDRLVLESEVPVMVMFAATWCGSCNYMSLQLDKLDSEFRGRFKFYTLDVVEDKFIQRQYNIQDIPTTIVFRNGEDIASFVRPLSAERLKEIVEQYL